MANPDRINLALGEVEATAHYYLMDVEREGPGGEMGTPKARYLDIVEVKDSITGDKIKTTREVRDAIVIAINESGTSMTPVVATKKEALLYGFEPHPETHPETPPFDEDYDEW
ncbi:hypothetical protein KJ742_02440 [Patescibacteria group bacterium]|nr:hypothetical protein [Patescibacteria group bacterium]MBU1682779.1 hypothetical protein [Patescibacteria group bacterium]